MIKFLLMIVILLTASSCTDHDLVMRSYKERNENSKELLLHGLNCVNCKHISSFLIEEALKGDQEAKEIIYSQIETLKGIQKSNHTIHPVPVIIRR